MIRPGRPIPLLLGLVLASATLRPAASQAAPAREPCDFGYFLRRLIDLDHLPVLEEGTTCKQFSSYDRRSRYDAATGQYIDWDANADRGQFLRVEGDEAVMAEMQGPGCIVRIWSANPESEIRFYLDGDTEPTFALPFADLFSGRAYPFVPPLVWQRFDAGEKMARASHCYVPIPYARRCKVTLYPRADVYYHIGYMTFPSKTPVETFRFPLTGDEKKAVERVREVLRNAFDASTMTTDAGRAEIKKSIGRKNKIPPDPLMGFWQRRRAHSERDRVTLRPGHQVLVAELRGPAEITGFFARLQSDDPQAFRRVLLQAFWDGSERPSIEAPLSEFFGSSFAPTVYHSLPMGRTSRWGYSYWRMPFAKSARLVVVNESRHPAKIRTTVIWRKKEDFPENTAYFYAKWRRDPQSEVFDYPFLEAAGRGRFVGVAHFIHNISGGWWGEGDEKVYVDGEKFPSTFGTGSEDYYGDAWGIRWFSNPFAGCPYSTTDFEDYSPGEMQSCYRWHIADFIPFERLFRITIENYSAKAAADRPKNDYASVAYWYQLPGGSDFFQPYPVAQRLLGLALPKGAVEAESAFDENDLPRGVSIVTEETTDQALSGHAAVQLVGPVGAQFDLPLKAAASDHYAVKARTVEPTDAAFEMLMDGKPIGERTLLRADGSPLAIRLTSKPRKADQGRVVIDYFDLVPHRNFVTRWLVIGPFDNAGDKGFARAYPPETDPFDIDATHAGLGGKKVGWREVSTDLSGLIHFGKLYPSVERTVFYAACAVQSALDQTVDLFAGSDDGIKVWLNGQPVLSHNIDRGYSPDDEHVKVNLKRGENFILVKIDNGVGDMGFALRLADPGETLRYGLPK